MRNHTDEQQHLDRLFETPLDIGPSLEERERIMRISSRWMVTSESQDGNEARGQRSNKIS
jgi:hypothetical protein